MKKKESKIIKKALQCAQKAFEAEEVPVGAVIFETKTGKIFLYIYNIKVKKND